MKVNDQNRLKDFKNLSIEPRAMKSVKGGSSWKISAPDGGGSRPRRPTGMDFSFVGGLFGG